jgi:hypothetical protein
MVGHGLGVGESAVGEPDEGAIVGGLEGDFDGGRARRDQRVVMPPPGEHEAMWWVDFDTYCCSDYVAGPGRGRTPVWEP